MKKLAISLLLLAGAGVAQAQDLLPEDNGLYSYHRAPRWRESESHPLRIMAYIVHPIGWALREGLFRPISYIAGSTEVTRSVFGFREPFDFKQPMCFHEDITDCTKVAPMNMIGGRADTGVEGVPGEEVVQEERVVFPDVAFDFDKSNLNPLGRARVRQISQMLSSMPTVNVVVEGHTDYIGSDDYNNKLGSRRAETVVRELTELGIDKSRISPVTFGESRPLYTEQTDWARAANRRVQFSVKGAEPLTTAGPVVPTTTESGLPAAAH